MDLVDLFPPFSLGIIGFPLICMAFISGCLTSIELLIGFLRQVVASRRDEGIRKWKGWLREDLGSRPYAWLRPGFCSSISPSWLFMILILSHLRFWSSLILLMLSFVRPGFLIFVGLVILRYSSDRFLGFIGHFLPQQGCLDLPRITLVVTCKKLLVRKRLLLVVWMVGLGMRLRRFPCLGFLVLLFSWNLLSLLPLGPQGLLMLLLP